MIKNVLKIVFLGVLGFGLLVYLTAPTPPTSKEYINNKNELHVKYLPSHFEFVNDSFYTKKQDLFNQNEESYIIVANHDSLVVLNELYKYTNKKIILIANISRTPWVIKKMAVEGKLEELYKDSKIKIVNDSNGAVVNILGLNDITQNKYFVYKVFKEGSIKLLSSGSVKLDALQKGISQEEIQVLNKAILEVLN